MVLFPTFNRQLGIFLFGQAIAGVGGAFNNQIRFSAAEHAGDEKALIHSWVLMFSLFAAFLGPWMIQFGEHLLPFGEYTGSLALLFGALVLVFVYRKAV